MDQEMYYKKVFVTPEMAAAWLSTNPRNRNIKRDKVAKLTAAIKNGEYELTHQCVALDCDGMLIDGHHRLNAIVAAGIATWMPVMFNAPNSSKIDIGAPRSDRDSMYMAGYIEKGSNEWNCLTYPLIGLIASRNFTAHEAREVTAKEKHNIYIKYQAYIDPIIDLCKSAKGSLRARGSHILYAMLCAAVDGVSMEKIKKWYKVLCTGDFFVEGDENATKYSRSVLLLRNFLMNDTKPRSRNGEDAVEVIQKTMSSIRYFDKGYANKKLYGEMVYPDIVITKKDLKGE